MLQFREKLAVNAGFGQALANLLRYQSNQPKSVVCARRVLGVLAVF
jgi:hypothetical protein